MWQSGVCVGFAKAWNPHIRVPVWRWRHASTRDDLSQLHITNIHQTSAAPRWTSALGEILNRVQAWICSTWTVYTVRINTPVGTQTGPMFTATSVEDGQRLRSDAVTRWGSRRKEKGCNCANGRAEWSLSRFLLSGPRRKHAYFSSGRFSWTRSVEGHVNNVVLGSHTNAINPRRWKVRFFVKFPLKRLRHPVWVGQIVASRAAENSRWTDTVGPRDGNTCRRRVFIMASHCTDWEDPEDPVRDDRGKKSSSSVKKTNQWSVHWCVIKMAFCMIPSFQLLL